MSYFIVLLFLIMFGIGFAYLFKRTFAQTCALTNFLYILFIYVGGLFLRIDIGAYVFIAFGLLICLFASIKAARNKESNKIIKIATSPTLLLYLILGIGMGAFFFNKISFRNDELTHWALVVKNMFYYDNFGNVGNTTTMFNKYVPATGLFMYGFQIFNTAFQNGNLYPAFNLLAISMMLPLFDFFEQKYTIKNIIVALVCIVVSLALPAIFKNNMYINLQVDALLAVMWSYLYLIYAVNKGKSDFFSFLVFGLGAFTLMLTKESGLPLFVFAVVIIFIDMLTINKKNMKELVKKPVFWVGLAIIVIFVVFAKLSWSMYCDKYVTKGGWNSSEMTLDNILKWLQSPTEWQSNITNRFMEKFFLGKCYYYGRVALQTPQVYVVALFAILFIPLGIKRKSAGFGISEFVVISLLEIGYGMYLLLMYLFSFSYVESERFASYPRYMLTATCGMFMIIAYMYMDSFARKSEKNAKPARELSAKHVAIFRTAFAIVLIITLTVLSVLSIQYSDRKKYRIGKRDYQNWVEITQKLNPEEDSVYYVMIDFNEVEYVRTRFFCSPVQCSGYTEGGSYKDGREGKGAYTGNPFILGETTEEEFVKETAKYKYLFVEKDSAKFVKQFGKYFENGQVKAQVLYKVKKDNNTIKFVLAE